MKARRRTFTAENKQRVLASADGAAAHGGIGASLRREGLCSSHVVTWRRERRAGIVKGLTPRTQGPKPTRSPQDEGAHLRSTRTMYRVLAHAGESRERRDQLVHPAYQKPELLATAPHQLWSWDITKLLGRAKRMYFCLS